MLILSVGPQRRSSMYILNVGPQWTSSMYILIVHPQCISSMYILNVYPQSASSISPILTTLNAFHSKSPHLLCFDGPEGRKWGELEAGRVPLCGHQYLVVRIRPAWNRPENPWCDICCSFRKTDLRHLDATLTWLKIARRSAKEKNLHPLTMARAYMFVTHPDNDTRRIYIWCWRVYSSICLGGDITIGSKYTFTAVSRLIIELLRICVIIFILYFFFKSPRFRRRLSHSMHNDALISMRWLTRPENLKNHFFFNFQLGQCTPSM